MNETQPTGVNLLAQADLLLFLSRAFTEPSAETRAEFDAVADGFGGLAVRAGAGEANRLTDTFRAACAEAKRLERDAWSDEFYRLFDCGVECPINESRYIRRDKGAILGEIAGFYRAFGLKLSENERERVDHLVCELEFFALLLVKLAQARDRGDHQAANITEKAIDSFNFYHLGDWLLAFCERLDQTTALPFYRHMATLLIGVRDLICEQNHLSARGFCR